MGAATGAVACLALVLLWYAFVALVIAWGGQPTLPRPAPSLALIAAALGIPLLTAGIRLTPASSYSLEITVLSAATALAAHMVLHRDLPPLPLARRRSLGYALITLLATLLYAALVSGARQARPVPGAGLILAAGLVVIGVLLVLPGLTDRFTLWIERRLPPSGYAARRMVQEVAVAAPAVLDLEPLAAMILERTLQTLDIRWGLFALWDHTGRSLQAVAARGLSEEAQQAQWGPEHPLTQWLLTAHEDTRARCLPDSQPSAGLPHLDTAWIVPVRLHEEPVGIFLYGPHGKSGALSATERNILDLLANETAAAVANARLFDQVARARREWLQTFDALSDGIFLHDRQGRVLRANRALARLMGRSFEQIIGRPWFEIIPAGPEARAMCAPPLEDVQARGATEYDLRWEGQRTLHITVSRLSDDDEFCVHVVRDVTDERALQGQLAQAEKLAAIGQMLSGIAHELNNPLTTIIGFSELLQDANVPDEVRADLERISRQAKRSARIVQGLLAFARQGQMQLTEVDVNALVTQVVESEQPRLQARGIALTLQLDPSLPCTLADAGQLQQVLLNLLANAEQALAEQQSERCIHIRTQPSPGALRIAIADNGPGIPRHLLQRVFDPFFTTKTVGKGTGLGLSICYGIVREHGGRIWAESEPEQGATFVIELPVRHAGTTPPVPATTRRSARRRILVVEDEALIAALIRRVLEPAGHELLTAADGEQGLAALAQACAQGHAPDLIVADLKMPKLDGPGFYARVVRDYPALAQRFLFITGDTIRPESQTFLQSTRLPYLRKPFTVQELQEAVAKAGAREA